MVAAVAMVLTTTSVATPVAAQFAYPPPPAAQTFEPIEANPYFVQDEQDPRILHSAPGAKERGIDRGYIERMARPRIPAETLDALEQALPKAEIAPIGTLNPSASPGLNIDGATVINGNIIVIEGTNQFVGNTQNGLSFDHNGGGLQKVVGDVWTRLGDEFDFITVFTSFDDQGVAAYYLPLQQTVTGLGECNFNTGATFGCVFNQLQQGSTLQGFVFMNSLSYWRSWDRQMDGVVHDISSWDHSLYPVLGQEVAHRWGSGLRFVNPDNGRISTALLGRDQSHWAGWVDTDASVMDGVDWEARDDGSFLAVDDMFRFSTLDLYTMGALPVGAAKPFFYIDGARFIPNQFVGAQAVPAELTTYLPSIEYLSERGVDLEVTGTRKDLTIQDIVNAEGNRCPDPDHTQKQFKQAIVLVTRPGQTAAQVASDVAALEQAREVWEGWWRENTGRRLSLCTDLGTTVCPHAEARLSGGEVEGENQPGGEIEVMVDVSAEGDAVQNARLLVAVSGNGAEEVTLESEAIDIGDVEAGEKITVPVKLTLDDDYTCGYSINVNTRLVSDNAEDQVASYRVFPGYSEIIRESFAEDDATLRFYVNDDGLDQTESGAFVRDDVFLSCDMTPRTPERDNTPDDDGAYITGTRTELSGDTSLWSDRIDLGDALDPELRFAFWLDGVDGKFSVALSDDADSYRTVKEYEDGFHEWSTVSVNIAEAFGGEVPSRVWVRFIAEGDGVEAGLDDFVVLDRVGQCAPSTGAFADCGCNASNEGGGPATAAAAMALLGLFFIRRRRR